MKKQLYISVVFCGTLWIGCAEPNESASTTEAELPVNPGYQVAGTPPGGSPVTPPVATGDSLGSGDTIGDPLQDAGNWADNDTQSNSDGMLGTDTNSSTNDGGSGEEVQPEDTASSEDTIESPEEDSQQVPDATADTEEGEVVIGDGTALSGHWWVAASPKSQSPCGYEEIFMEQNFVLVVGEDNTATGTLEPPGLFITLDFTGALNGSQLTMVAYNTEAGPPSIGWATEHTYTIDVSVVSQSYIQGTYTHELVPNDGEPCTLTWNIAATK
jgi:hypothetical protein